MNNTQETSANIIAEMRYGTIPKHRTDHELLALYADRLEAAILRECKAPDAVAAILHDRLYRTHFASACDNSGNVVAMREALEAARDLLLPQCNGGTAFAKACGETVNKIMDALAAPPRNCDVGTTEEQQERFSKFCFASPCKVCQIHLDGLFGDCGLHWAQMPYEAEKGETSGEVFG